MKNTILLLVFICTYSLSFSQKLTNCSQCSTTKYTITDIKENTLYHLQVLRNEIFARHDYQFDNQRLEEHFLNFNWYIAKTKNVVLNPIEKHNIAIFQKKEGQIKQHRKELISALQEFKKAIIANDHDVIAPIFKPFFTRKDDMYTTLLNAISRVFNYTELDEIHWFKNQAQYSVEIDNGFSITSLGIYIKEDTIFISISDPESHSNLMDTNNNEAFEYPSTYYSESENSSGGQFQFKNGKLLLTAPLFAG